MTNPTSVRSAAPQDSRFVSYDRDADGDLHDLIAEKASKEELSIPGHRPRSSGHSSNESDGALRRSIREADQVIVICGEHADSSVAMATELRVPEEEEASLRPAWGRRERMCTKPMTAKSADAIYSWTGRSSSAAAHCARAAWSHEQMAEHSRERLARAAKAAPASAPGPRGASRGREPTRPLEGPSRSETPEGASASEGVDAGIAAARVAATTRVASEEPRSAPSGRGARSFLVRGFRGATRSGVPIASLRTLAHTRRTTPMQRSERCANDNHSRSNVTVRCCPNCGRIVNARIPAGRCLVERHAAARRVGSSYCAHCGERIAREGPLPRL